jgi:hypothetical protein
MYLIKMRFILFDIGNWDEWEFHIIEWWSDVIYGLLENSCDFFDGISLINKFLCILELF